MPQVPTPPSPDARATELATDAHASMVTTAPAPPCTPVPAPLAFLGDRAFLGALALALPACIAFALAPWFGVVVRVPSLAWQFLLLYPVLEELAFRGLVQGQLLRLPALARPHVTAISMANVLTAAAFAAAHLLREPWPWAVATFVPGLVFGWARERSGGVLAPMVLHVAYNVAVWLGAWLTTGIAHWLPAWVAASTVLAPAATGGGG